MSEIAILAILAQRTTDFRVTLTLNGVIALVAGLLILLRPRLLNYIVAFYLIAIGLIELLDITI